ncbi:MAG: spheroidene monooxygenase, partial [Hymenobacteraceae bacterium]|nr:spheroidene monooxygenase [Hymenobacteraceae bacterium]MDX5395239.1 spheroidene monooxygenase [Hymenobacteraceae bacterium]MDX5511277.1 spheroidene monooxygenase [Hymenobacteraceae bacterium]
MAAPLLTTFSVFHVKKGRARQALAQMGTLPPVLKKVPGLQFAKLMGCGRGKVFSILPDFYRYTLFATWASESA